MNVTLYNAAMAYANITATNGITYHVSSVGAVTIPDTLTQEFIRLGFSQNAGGGGGAARGSISGNIADQEDLDAALDAKAGITGATDIAVVATIPGDPDPDTVYIATE